MVNLTTTVTLFVTSKWSDKGHALEPNLVPYNIDNSDGNGLKISHWVLWHHPETSREPHVEGS